MAPYIAPAWHFYESSPLRRHWLLFQKKPITSWAQPAAAEGERKIMASEIWVIFSESRSSRWFTVFALGVIKNRICGDAITQAHVGNSSVRGKRKSTHGKTKRLTLTWAFRLLLSHSRAESMCVGQNPCLISNISGDEMALGDNVEFDGGWCSVRYNSDAGTQNWCITSSVSMSYKVGINLLVMAYEPCCFDITCRTQGWGDHPDFTSGNSDLKGWFLWFFLVGVWLQTLVKCSVNLYVCVRHAPKALKALRRQSSLHG